MGEKIRNKIWMILLLSVLVLSGCGFQEKEGERETPEQVLCQTMESLKELDLEKFNEYTDNYVGAERNWIGVVTRREYKVFSELQQPGFKGGKWYEANYKFAEKIVEHMTWEIKDVRQNGEKAEIDMEISNIDMQKVMGEYEILILENMLESGGSGIGQLIRDMLDLANGKEDLINLMDDVSSEQVCRMEVAVDVYQIEGQWQVNISDDFINAFMGNIMAEKYPEELEERINELTQKYEKKMEEWGEKTAEDVEKWMNSLGI
ncbi:MAG: hypothetical protein OSJ60_13070 [Lachnospiraceae bacterium]|nr:hypothetical protein [Lachnospiraceae bacterium]